jgi:hypothetical protein
MNLKEGSNPNPDKPEPNSKSEARNSKQIKMFKRVMIKTGLAAT